MRFRTPSSFLFFFRPIPKMEVQQLLKRILLLLLMSYPIHGQSQQHPHSNFIQNRFSSVHGTLGSFNRFSYIPRPVGPFPASGYRPGDMNFAYPHHPFAHPVPQQPVLQFTAPPARTRQSVPIPTPPSKGDEVRQQLPPVRSTNSDMGISAHKHSVPPPPLTIIPSFPDNRHFNDVRLIQPQSVAHSENTRKEIPAEKFHKPIFADAAFGSDGVRKAVALPVDVPSASDGALVGNKNPSDPYNSELFSANANHNNVSIRPAQPTNILPQVNKERRPFDNFKPLLTDTKQFSGENPALPQHTETHSSDSVNYRDKTAPEGTPTAAPPDTALVPSDSRSHSVYVKQPDEPAKKPTILNEDKLTHEVPNEPSSLSPPKEETRISTQKLETISDAPSKPASGGPTSENLPAKRKMWPPVQPNEELLVNENNSPPKVIPLSESDRFDDVRPVSNWALGGNKVLTGTPEEILALKLADAINSFGFGLYGKLQESNNLFFSPLSVSAALAIVLEGASNMTALQMMNVLHLSESNIRPDEVKTGFKHLMVSLKSKRSDYQFENANLLLLQNKFFFKSQFSNTVYKYYKPLLGSVDFAANGLNIKRNVNDWVNRRTHGKINQFLKEQLPPETVFAVLNAVYFRGQWAEPFDSAFTKSELFYNYGKDPIEITMMKQTSTFPVGYSVDLRAQIIELPYEGEETSMVILLPEEHDGIYQLRNRLNYQELYVILSAIDVHLVQLSLPRFSLRSRYDMEDVLKKMGMRDVFIPGKANFARMTNVTGLYLSKVSHEGVIDVDEKGTEASGSTGGFLVPLSKPRTVIVNHPFFFFIRNRNNGAILFIGQFDAFDA